MPGLEDASAKKIPASSETAPEGLDPLVAKLTDETRQDLQALLAGFDTLEMDGAKIQVLDAKPAEAKTEVPAVFVPGFLFTKTSPPLVNIIQALKGKGRRTLAMMNIHGIDTKAVRGLHIGQLRKAAAIIKMLDAKGIKQTDLVGHSEGAIIATMVAKLRPDLVRNLVLYNPAGLKEAESTAALLGRFVFEGIKELFRGKTHTPTPDGKIMGQIGAREAQAYLKGDHLHTAREVAGMGQADVRKDVQDLQKQGKGVSIITGKRDFVFPHARRRRKVNRMTGVPPEHIRTVSGGHLFQGPAETEELAQAIDEELDKQAANSAAPARGATCDVRPNG